MGAWDIPAQFDRGKEEGCIDPFGPLENPVPHKAHAPVLEDDEDDESQSFCGRVDVTPDKASLGIRGSMLGRLKRCLPFWYFIGASLLVISWITSGYVLPFEGGVEPTVPFHGHNHPRVYTPEFGPPTATMVADLLRAGAVRIVKEKPFYVSPLDTVGKGEPGSGKYRLILDLRTLNKAMRKYKFRMETLARRKWMFVPGGWMISADLTSAYQHVNINEEHCKYLGFEWEGQWYEFTTLPFGGDFAPWAFTELSKQITMFLSTVRGEVLALP